MFMLTGIAAAAPPSDPPPVYTSAQAYVSPVTQSDMPGYEPWEPIFKEQLITKGKGQVVITAQSLANKLDQVDLGHTGYLATQSALLDMHVISEPAPSLGKTSSCIEPGLSASTKYQ